MNELDLLVGKMSPGFQVIAASAYTKSMHAERKERVGTMSPKTRMSSRIRGGEEPREKWRPASCYGLGLGPTPSKAHQHAVEARPKGVSTATTSFFLLPPLSRVSPDRVSCFATVQNPNHFRFDRSAEQPPPPPPPLPPPPMSAPLDFTNGSP
ncbi:hypothetical protein NL676_023476 [Syzygium grande]|nr:hypothetical protein NL676_023476 [Syzygium grande]